MKKTKRNQQAAWSEPNLTRTRIPASEKLTAQIQRIKEALLAEFSATRAANEQLLRLALIEAEALAWRTAYPHLVFPVLAREKAEAVAAWVARQHSLLHPNAPWALAA